jgi:HSP20 family protein
VIRWSPSTELANLHGAMDRLFEDFFGGSAPPANGQRSLPTYFLPLDVREVEDGYEIQAQLPGFKPEEVDVTFSEGVLRIQAQHSEQSQQQSGGWLRREVAFGNYQRAIQLPGDTKEEDISASFENGVLTVMVPKVPRPQPKRIEVSSGSQKKLTGRSS